MGSVAQFRVMGGVVGLAIITSAFNGFTRPRLDHYLTTAQVAELLKTPTALIELPPAIQENVRMIFADGYNLELKILCGLAAGQIPASFLMWQKRQIRV